MILGHPNIDLGGEGRCGYAAIGAALAVINGKSNEEVKSSAKLLAKSLRLRIATAIDKNIEALRPIWKPDKDADEHKETKWAADLFNRHDGSSMLFSHGVRNDVRYVRISQFTKSCKFMQQTFKNDEYHDTPTCAI